MDKTSSSSSSSSSVEIKEEIVSQTDLSIVTRDKHGHLHIRSGTQLADATVAGINKFAMERLRSDLKECINEPLPTIAAMPLDSDIFRWHANLMGPPGSFYEDICFHFVIEIPRNYPREPPKIKIKSQLSHPNVFGSWICLDMLQGQWVPNNPNEKKTDVGYGWTPAYTIQTILIQLQAFLFDQADTTYWAKIMERYQFGSTQTAAREAAKHFECKECSHTGKKPWPEPLAWKERLRYMVPSDEITDIKKTREELWSFIENVDSMCVANAWPALEPLKQGSFFSWTLLPWWDERYLLLCRTKKDLGTKQMPKNQSKVIQGMIHDAIRLLNARPLPPPNKALYLERMYRIEAALDLAVHMTYASKSRERERGYWQWYNVDIGTLSRSKNSEKKKETAEEQKDVADKGEWIDFPVAITHQIEALYLRWQADLRRPGELVRFIDPSKSKRKGLVVENADDIDEGVKDKKDEKARKKGTLKDDYSDFGIITYPLGYYTNRVNLSNLTEAEKRVVYQPYGNDSHVRVMKLDPLRTIQNDVAIWEYGPRYYRGQKMWACYTKADGKKYYKNSMILDRFQKPNGVWCRVYHPLPTSKDTNRAELYDVSTLQLASVGKFFKSYVLGPDNKHYVVDVNLNMVRCVEDQKAYQIRRRVQTKTTEELWHEISKQVDKSDKCDVPWKQPQEEEVKPLPLMDWKKWARVCPFLDVSEENNDEETDEEDEDEEDEEEKKKESNNEGAMKKTKKINNNQKHKKNKKITEVENDEKKEEKNGEITHSQTKYQAEIAKLKELTPEQRSNKPFPSMSTRVSGQVVKMTRYGIFIDIGLSRDALLHISQIKAPKELWQSMISVEDKHTKTSNTINNSNRFSDEIYDLPRTIRHMGEVPFDINDYIPDLWVDDVDTENDRVSLTQFRPLNTIKVGDYLSGHVRRVMASAVLLDVGAEVDAYLHKTQLEAGLMHQLVFDCRHETKLGQTLKVCASKVDLGRAKLDVCMDLRDKMADHLTLPGDFNESKAVKVSIFGLLPDDINEMVFQYLDRGSIHYTRKVCRLFERIIDDKTSLRWDLDELKCFHSKRTFRDEVIGMGVMVDRYPNSGVICAIEPKLDLISANSVFAYDVRMSVWKEPFSHWLPVYINPEHGKKSLPWAKQVMSQMIDPKKVKDWNPFYALKIIPALMNTMVVRVMKGDLHESIVALEGYTMFYHLLLAIILEYPSLQTFIDRNIGNFLKDEEQRNKKHIPSLGEWIALLATSNVYVWRDVATTYLRENFDRHVKWILMQNKKLLDPKAPKGVRIKKSFNASQVSLKLCMFHVCFLRLFRYSQRSGTVMSVEQTKKNLDSLYGRPTHNMKLTLQRNTKRIKKIRTWKQFFAGVGVKVPQQQDLFQWLVEALQNSERRGYHKPHHYLPKKKKQSTDDGGDRFDAAGEAWENKHYGGSLVVQEKKAKKMSIGDQMIASF